MLISNVPLKYTPFHLHPKPSEKPFSQRTPKVSLESGKDLNR